MRKLSVFFAALLLLSFLNACNAEEVLEPTETPSLTATSTPSGRCSGLYTGITVQMPNNDWKCRVETNDDANETFFISSSLYTINISTLGRGPFCEPALDGTCTQSAFYENKAVSLTAYSAGGELKEIYGLTRLVINGQRVPVSYSIKYQDMEHRTLDPGEKQELINFLDSITYSK